MPELNLNSFNNEVLSWFGKSIIPAPSAELDKSDFGTVIDIFSTDYKRYFQTDEILIENILRRLELCGILMYRVANRLFLQHGDEQNAERYSNLGRFISGFEIYYSAIIGEGLKINHGLGSVIGARCRIGSNALLHQGITLGDRKGQRPVLGDSVTVYAGAKILGGIQIGDHSIIGANCVCMTDAPPHSVVVGIPGKILKNEQQTT